MLRMMSKELSWDRTEIGIAMDLAIRRKFSCQDYVEFVVDMHRGEQDSPIGPWVEDLLYSATALHFAPLEIVRTVGERVRFVREPKL